MTEEIKKMIEKEINNNNFELNKLQIAEMYDYITNLQKEKDNYKQRNEKAVEYIEKNILNKKIKDVNWEYDECYFSDMPVERIKPLLNILQGGDE